MLKLIVIVVTRVFWNNGSGVLEISVNLCMEQDET